MLNEVAPGIFMDTLKTGYVGVPSLNYFFVPGKPGHRSLMVDAGLSENVSPLGKDMLIKDLRDLHIPFEGLDCIITHAHRDHVGLAHFLNDAGAEVYINPVEMKTSEEQYNYHVGHPELRKKLFHRIGVELYDPESYDDMWRAADNFVEGFHDSWIFDWDAIHPGDEVSYGDYHFRLVLLPGHTRGHMGLWDKEKQILFSGDVLLRGVTPIVGDTGDYHGALEDYLDSLRDVKHVYGDCLFLPGHGKPFRDPAEIVDKTVNAYLEKCSAMYDIIRKSEEPLCIRAVAVRAYGREGKKMTDAERRSCILIWFKTAACLNYMKHRGLVKETVTDGVSMWSV